MVDIYIPDETHTLASMLRERLEAECPNDLVTCTHEHPEDTVIRVTAPSVTVIRTCLLHLQSQIGMARTEVQRAGPPVRSATKSSAVPEESTDGTVPGHVAPVRRSHRLNR